MIRFFRFSGPLQFGFLFLLIWLFRLPLFITDAPNLCEDVKNLAIGEKLANGFLIYRDLIDSSAPISSFIFWILNLVSGKSIAFMYIIAGFILLIQSYLFKWICNKNEILTDKGDLPALIYIVVSSTCFDFFSLSPAFISITFILLALYSVFRHVKTENNEGEIFSTGLYLGLAYLCFSPALIYFVLTFLTFLIFTRTIFRHYLLMFTGFIFPVLFFLTFFYLLEGVEDFIGYYLFEFPAVVGFKEEVNWKKILFLILPSFLLAIVGIFRAVTYRRFIIYQVISQRIMFIWLLASVLIVVFFFKNVTTAFTLIIPFAAYFICHFFQLMKRKSLGGYLLLIFVIYNFRMVYSYIEIPFLNKNLTNFNNQVIEETKWNKIFINKRIWVVGEEISVYKNNHLATCYLNFKLSHEILAHPEFYENLTHIYHALSIDMPDIIIDKERLVPAIFEKIPFLKNKYAVNEMGVYIKK